MANTPANRKSPRKSPRKSASKSSRKTAETKLSFTGKVRVVFELEDYGPMEIRVDDIAVALAIINVLIGDDRCVLDVKSYDAAYATTLTQLFEP